VSLSQQLMPVRRFLLWCTMLLVLGLSGCGFRLRGELTGTLEGRKFIVSASDYYSPITVALRRQLNTLGADVLQGSSLLTSKNEQVTRVTLSKLDEERTTLSVDTNGRPLEYRLQLLVDISIHWPGVSDDEKDRVSVRRVLLYDNTQLLAKEREQKEVRHDLQRELIARIVERLRIHAS